MKKNFIKLGAVALVLVLTLIFAACEQPTEEEVKFDTVIRLWFEKSGKSLDATDIIAIDLGRFEADTWTALTQPGAVDASLISSGTAAAPTFAAGKGADAMVFDRTVGGVKVPPIRTLAKDGISHTGSSDPYTPSGGTVSGITIVQDMITQTKEGTYVDLFLYRTLQADAGGSDLSEVWQKSGSYYVKLYVEQGTGGMPTGVYIYTPGATSRNQPVRENPVSGAPIYNSNVKRFSFKAGLNNVYLANFSM
jgi:hypothetical protein